MYSKNVFLKRIKFYWFAQLGFGLDLSTIVLGLISKCKVWLTSGSETSSSLKLVSTIFYQFLIFTSNVRSSKTMKKISLLHLKSSFRSRDYQIFVNFFLPFHTFQIQKGKWKWNNLWCHKFACVNLQIEFLELTQKLLCITSSDLVR